MASYVILINYTEQGVKDMKNFRARRDATRAALQQAGGRLISFYLTLGQYDAVAVIEVPDATTAARVGLGIAALGNLRTATMQAFTEDETIAITESLP